MEGEIWDRGAAVVVSPAVGAIAPALWMWLRAGAGLNAISIGGPCIWALTNLALGYAVVLPVLVVLRRTGMRARLGFWLAAGVVGTPIAYAWANPAAFADDPTVTSSPAWGLLMAGYMSLFGVTGLLYAAGASRRP